MVDFGLAKELPKGFREGCVAFAGALLTGKSDGMARALEDMGFETRDGGRDALERIAALLLDAAAAVRHQSYADRESLRGYGREISRLVRENPIVRMPSHIVMLGRTVALLSGIGKALDVHVDMLKIILPYVMGTAPSRKPRT
jgi:predicted unusual protein kinase regulating ubiquinone biosynthesis (AarF/ABC1/UbiB family)